MEPTHVCSELGLTNPGEIILQYELYGDIPKISKSIRMQRLSFAGHCWRSNDELASDLLLGQPSNGKQPRRCPVKTYIYDL